MSSTPSLDDLKFVAAVAGAIGAAVAALIGGIIALIGNWLNRRSEERRHLFDLCTKMAEANLVRDTEIAKAKSASTGQSVPIAPIDAYLIHMLALMKAVKTSKSQKDMLDEWQRISGVTRLAIEKVVKSHKCSDQH